MTTLIKAHEDGGGNTYYEPFIATVRGVSQYRDNQFSFVDLDGWWTWNGTVGLLAPGKQVLVTLKTKLKPPGENTKPGALYQDVSAAEEVDPTDPPEGFETNYDSQGAANVAPEGGDTSVPENTPAIPTDYGFAEDARGQSIREQAFYNHFAEMSPDLLALLPADQQDVLLQAFWETALRLMAPAVRERATLRYAELTQADESDEGEQPNA